MRTLGIRMATSTIAVIWRGTGTRRNGRAGRAAFTLSRCIVGGGGSTLPHIGRDTRPPPPRRLMGAGASSAVAHFQGNSAQIEVQLHRFEDLVEAGLDLGKGAFRSGQAEGVETVQGPEEGHPDALL